MPAGRPSDYTQELADNICEALAMGRSMRSVCRDEDMPAMSTVFRWLREKPEFQEQYTRAKEESADAMAEEMLSIADDADDDYTDHEDKGRVVDREHIQRSRLKIETRKWLASKLRPKKYGDKVQQEVTGKDGGPIENKWSVEFVNADKTE